MNEAKLIKRASKGDADAISMLYQIHKEKVYKFIYFKVASEADAEDLFQEVIMAAFQSLDRFRGEVSFLHWCYQIARNKIAYYFRKRYQKPTVSLNEDLILEEEPGEEPEVDELYEQRKAQLKQVVEEIEPPRYGEVLKLRFFEALTLTQVAEKLGITVNNVKVVQNRALKKATLMLNPS